MALLLGMFRMVSRFRLTQNPGLILIAHRDFLFRSTDSIFLAHEKRKVDRKHVNDMHLTLVNIFTQRLGS